MNRLIGLWRDTWWVWTGFLVLSVALAALVAPFFLLVAVCLPVPFAYFAFNRYDASGKEKADF